MYSIKTLLVALAALLVQGVAYAQAGHRQTDGPNTEASTDTVKIRSIKELFTKGEVEGHIRNYFMATINHKALSDNYANAIGARIGFRTAPLHGFRFGFAGLFTYNAFSSDLAELDPIAKRLPRNELELFDIQNPSNRSDLDRLDELYLEYRSEKLFAQAGRISFTSPLINPQDTRMKPYAAQGVQLQIPIQDQHNLTLAWLDHFSPRSTVEWVKAEESIGIYPTGVNPDGSPSEYEHHTNTKGVGIAGLKSTFGDKLQTEVWDYLIENVSNNLYGKANLALNEKVSVGLEGLYQSKVGTGGNEEEDKRYFAQENQWLIGSQLAYMPSSDIKLSLNYLHLGDGGRFLFPREWGREQFFVTQPRGRFEGSGKADVLNLRVLKKWSDNLSVEAGITKAWLPALENAALNKYRQPSYLGFVLDTQYAPKKPVLDGLSFRLLYVGRTSQNVPLPDMYYRTNFHQINFVTQITF